jgi:hypothetical protein
MKMPDWVMVALKRQSHDINDHAVLLPAVWDESGPVIVTMIAVSPLVEKEERLI